MSDERILGGSASVDSLLSHAGEKYERQYELKRRSYDLNRVVKRVAEIYSIDEHEVFSKGRQKEKVNARNLFCYWAVRELGISVRESSLSFFS
jgi:chromosomal replication initiation ATPase DnaA